MKYQKNDLIINPKGKIETVLMADNIQVVTYESLLSWYHPTKIRKATDKEITKFLNRKSN